MNPEMEKQILEDRAEERKRRLWKAFILLSMGFTASALACLGFSVYRERKLSKALKNAIKEVSDMTEVKVSEGIVNRGITEAVERECGRIARKAAEDVAHDISVQTQKKVAAAVDQQYARIKEGVADAFAKELARVDKDDIMEDITEKAKELLVEKFDGKLDSLLNDYNRNLENVGKIYQSIAESMTDKKGKTVTLVS